MPNILDQFSLKYNETQLRNATKDAASNNLKLNALKDSLEEEINCFFENRKIIASSSQPFFEKSDVHFFEHHSLSFQSVYKKYNSVKDFCEAAYNAFEKPSVSIQKNPLTIEKKRSAILNKRSSSVRNSKGSGWLSRSSSQIRSPSPSPSLPQEKSLVKPQSNIENYFFNSDKVTPKSRGRSHRRSQSYSQDPYMFLSSKPSKIEAAIPPLKQPESDNMEATAQAPVSSVTFEIRKYSSDLFEGKRNPCKLLMESDNVKKIQEIIYKYESWQTFKENEDNKKITFKQWLDIEEKDKMKVKLENQAIIQKDLQFCKKVDLPLKSESELLSSTLFLDTKKTESNPDMVVNNDDYCGSMKLDT
ncbi:hypothetical protein Psal071_03583 (plasmid) [Piscirickettsia salmonis]|uniref:Uncharacterized protein n=1 Tax=Piscirickettsia salmonis TaxID=1238 RepID=A0A9Q6LMZ8_PISSA|nr:hypothetical protein [Piscirickettsia salmonis]QGN96908.1 hypothetical protein Psal006a_03563 [Piscirickettsia salmonis]QGO07757.1 hypothetical protein Psal009_03716 [Piscirickettsia salmonis]QGO36217.1 hypothetical protein Psal028_03604 [Piscirickettsia salmonis]QGO39841.1 hypothetical protein Psal040_03618 [Piscirickettsia salmonis]QGO43404.1 hypothetical protein Psal041_03555 [Piscirickettsia salmonis]